MKKGLSFVLLLAMVGMAAVFSGCSQSGTATTTTTSASTSSTSTASTTTTSVTTTTIGGFSAVAVGLGGVKVTSVSGLSALSPADTVTGYVYEVPGNTGKQGVIVWAGTSISAETDANGAYTLSGVPGDTTTFTAVYYSINRGVNVSSCYIRNADESMPATIDFYAGKEATLETVSVTVTVTDETGNPVSVAAVAYDELYSRAVWGFTNSSGVYSSNLSLLPINNDHIIVGVSKFGVGGAYTSEITGSAATPIDVNLCIGQQASATGEIISSYSYDNLVVGVNSASTFPYYMLGLFSSLYATPESGVYNFTKLPVPIAGDSLFLYGTGYTYTGSQPGFLSGCDVKNVSPTAGTNVTQNFSIPESVSVVSVTSSESAGITWLNITWEAPSSWTPSGYLVGSYYGGACTNANSISIPMWLPAGTNPIYQVQIFAMRSPTASILDWTTALINGYGYTVY